MAPAKVKNEHHRRVAVDLLERGIGTPTEIAKALGEDRQLVYQWALKAHCDWRRQRRLHVERCVKRALSGS